MGVEGLLLHTTQKLYIEYNMIVAEIIAVNIYYIVQSKQLP